MTAANEFLTDDGRYAERIRWAAEMQLMWDAEDAAAQAVADHEDAPAWA